MGVVVPEPAAKRKTLIDRAGEMPRPQQAPSSSARITNSTSKGRPGGGARHTPSLSSQTPSAASRAKPNGSLSHGVDTGNHLPSTNAPSRPTSAIGHTNTPTDFSVPAARPASVLGSSSTASARAALGKRKGTTPISVSHYLPHLDVSALEDLSERESYESQAQRGSTRSSSPFGDNQSSFARGIRDTSLNAAMRNLRITSNPSPAPDVDMFRCSTPSLIPKPCPFRVAPTPIPFTPSKIVKRAASPKKLPFLTRESHTKAWDTKGRLEDMEVLYSELSEKMDGTMRERNGLEESVDLYRSRSMCFFTGLL